MTTSRATAVWEGELRDGRGTFRAASGAFASPYSFQTRFEGVTGATPEELIAAAHASCLSMALSADLEKAGTPAVRVETEASCTIEAVGGKPTITTMALKVRGKVPGLDQAAFQQAAEEAKDNCPVSRALQGNVQFKLEATLQ
ncbi:MAG: OsmC family peroxiredoxin [Gemmatimonadales bacterium]